jgi:hypothetical protein
MAKRDPEKTARNKIIDELTSKLKLLETEVLKKTGIDSVHSLHGKIGGKYADYIDIKNEVITSADHFISSWLQGYKQRIIDLGGFAENSNEGDTFKLLQKHKVFKDYLLLFLERTYLRNYDALSKLRPNIEDSEIWIGQENAAYGLLITPRYRNDAWENDKSEIRHFEPKYWTIGHVLKTGLVIPDDFDLMTFASVEEYLKFFKNVIVRNSGSKYERAIAQHYVEYVNGHDDPESVPLLIPEFRYDGLLKKHKYRLDFTIIQSDTLNKVGFELSPWSSHGHLAKTASLTNKEINEMAKDNFEKEMRKHRDFFKKHGVFVMIYTDTELTDTEAIFEDMKKYLEPKTAGKQLKFHIMEDFFKKDLFKK